MLAIYKSVSELSNSKNCEEWIIPTSIGYKCAVVFAGVLKQWITNSLILAVPENRKKTVKINL
ncbi:7931_t:CDS:2 [Diversispora eburnea]|uniref:7931_t:CDS:1 n=1 Tax=Diversispora eburnea TaxID=1213867 RepID=A0A9N8ZE69_9GLOM|nr:7931_t:CDS:2 [Diversispora eburnea]